MLADCAKKYPVPQAATKPAPTDEECRRQGMILVELFSGPECGVDHQNRPCTNDELAAWKQAEVSRAVCTKRGDNWSEKARLCFRKGEFLGPSLCKR